MYNKFIDMLTILGTVGILILVCLFSVLHLQIGPPMVEATPFQVQPISKGGTGATTAADARTNLGVASETHASRHESSAADEIDVTPDMITLAEGKIVVGAATGEGEATTEIPNLTATVALSSDDTWSGLAYTANGGATITQWKVVFIDPNDTDSEWQVADADVSGDAPAWGVNVEECSNATECTVLYRGCFRNDAWQGVWDDGQLLFLSDTPADTTCTDDDCYGWTDTAPSTTGDVVQPLGRVRDDGSTSCVICVDVDHVNGWATVP